jgi:diguanylate cyclase (GGDEF)-like protein
VTLSVALRIIAGLIAMAAAGGSLAAFLRQRDRARLDAALLMAAMVVVLFTLDRSYPILAYIIGGVALFATPYLLLRLIDRTLVRVPRPWVWFALGSAVTSALIQFSDVLGGLDPMTPMSAAPELAAHLAALVAGPYVVLQIYAAVLLGRAARAATGTARLRPALVAAASLIALVPIIREVVRSFLEIPTLSDDFADRADFFVGVLAMLSYLVVFAPPAWARAAWQQRQLGAFLDELGTSATPGDSTAVLAALTHSVRDTLGAVSVAALRLDDTTRAFVVEVGEGTDVDTRLLSARPVREAARTSRVALARREDLEAMDAAVCRELGIRAVLVIPIASGNRTFGLLLVLAGSSLIFPTEDLDLVNVMIVQAAVVLLNARLLSEQRALGDQLFQSNVALEQSRHAAEETLRYHELHDPTTDLPNRTVIESRLAELAEVRRRVGGGAALLLLDLASFRDTNKIYGRETGDAVLRQIAGRLQKPLEENDTVASLGADRFVLLMPGADVARAESVAQQVHDAVSELFVIEGKGVHVTPTIAIAIVPVHGTDADSLLVHLEIALQEARRVRRPFLVFDPSLGEGATRATRDLAAIRPALKNGEFVLYYQPQVAREGDRVVGVEALIRWNRPGVGIVPPIDFLPLVDRLGLGRSLDHWVLRRALVECRAWREAGYPIHVSVNVGRDFAQDPGLVSFVEATLAEERMPADALQLEVVEDSLLTEREQVRDSLKRLEELGVVSSLDDFGSGYSSLGYIRDLPVQALKIDRLFVKNVLTESADATICRSAIDLAHGLGLLSVAEGVEDAELWTALGGMGCDLGQGYFFGRPMPLVELTRWFEDSRFGIASEGTASARQAQAERICELAERSVEGDADATESLREAEHAIPIAADWALRTRDAELALRFGGGLRRYWSDRGHVAAGAAYLNSALALAADRPHDVRYARALAASAMLIEQSGDHERARALFLEVMATMRGAGERTGLAETLSDLSVVAEITGDLTASGGYLTEVIGLRRALGQRHGEAVALNLYALNALGQGQFAEAATRADASISLHREFDDTRSLASALDSRGAIRVANGDVDGALDSYAESLTLARDGGFASGMAQVVEDVGMALATVDERVAALRLLSAVQAFREHAEVLPPSDRSRYRDTIVDLGADLPPEERDAAIVQGRELSVETAVAIALIAIGTHRTRSRVPLDERRDARTSASESQGRSTTPRW